MTHGPGSSPRAGFLRVNGMLVLVLLVASGFGVGAAYYSYKEPRVRRELAAELEAAPSTAEGRVQKWMEFFTPQAHHRLSVFARVSEEHPWIVTHTVEAPDGGEPYVHGLGVSDLPQEGLLVREGLTVVLTLDPVRLLGRARLGGDSAAHIPHYAADIPAAQADARLRETAEWLLRDVVKALASDIEGARFEVRTRGGG